MANIQGSNFVRWDTVAGAGFTAANGLPRNPRVKSIRIEVGAAGGTTTLQVDGKDYFSFNVVALSVLDFTYNPPQYMPALTMTAKGTNVAVTVTYE